jgi:hypothetical protein
MRTYMKFSWPVLSLFTIGCFSVMVTLITVITRRGISTPLMLFSACIVAIPIYFAQTIANGGFAHLTVSNIIILICIGILSVMGGIAQFEAVRIAPNPGLPLAVIGFYSALVAVIAVFVFKDKLTMMQIIGIITALIGVSLISLSGKA